MARKDDLSLSRVGWQIYFLFGHQCASFFLQIKGDDAFIQHPKNADEDAGGASQNIDRFHAKTVGYRRGKKSPMGIIATAKLLRSVKTRPCISGGTFT